MCLKVKLLQIQPFLLKSTDPKICKKLKKTYLSSFKKSFSENVLLSLQNLAPTLFTNFIGRNLFCFFFCLILILVISQIYKLWNRKICTGFLQPNSWLNTVTCMLLLDEMSKYSSNKLTPCSPLVTNILTWVGKTEG